MLNPSTLVGLAQQFAADAVAAHYAMNNTPSPAAKVAALAQYSNFVACLCDVLDEAHAEGSGPAAMAAMLAYGVRVHRADGTEYADPRTLN